MKLTERQAALSVVINIKNENIGGAIKAVNSCEEENFRRNILGYYEEKQKKLVEELALVTGFVKRLRGW